MRKVLKPGLLLTATACAGVGTPEEITHNPPRIPDATWEYPKAPFSKGQSLMLRDGESREIKGAGDSCFVEIGRAHV